MLEGVIQMSARNQVIIITPFTLAGAMAPITLAGALVQQAQKVSVDAVDIGAHAGQVLVEIVAHRVSRYVGRSRS